jgi:hypothetical protein
MIVHDSIRIRLSAGLVIVAIIHALALAVLCVGLRLQKPTTSPAPWNVPCAQQPDGGDCYHTAARAVARPLQQPPPSVNLSAQGELKQQIKQQQCNNCNPFYLRPGETLLHVGPARPTGQPTLAPPDPLAQPLPPSVLSVTDAQTTRPQAKQYQLLLFLDNSYQAVNLKAWFSSNAELVALRQRSETQVYTPDNALYKQRFANVMPPQQFPAVILQDASGGHIHAAGRTMLPQSAEQLVGDFRKSYELYKQAKQGNMQATGAIRETGYRWDDGIHPAMRLYSDDECGPGGCDPDNCGPDGCQPEDRQPWRPLDRDGGGLFNRPEPASALVWMNSQEIWTMGLLGIGAIAAVVLLTKLKR